MFIKLITPDTRLIILGSTGKTFNIHKSSEGFRYINSDFYRYLYKLKGKNPKLYNITWAYEIAKRFGWSGRGYSPEFKDMKVFTDFLNSCITEFFPYYLYPDPQLICLWQII